MHFIRTNYYYYTIKKLIIIYIVCRLRWVPRRPDVSHMVNVYWWNCRQAKPQPAERYWCHFIGGMKRTEPNVFLEAEKTTLIGKIQMFIHVHYTPHARNAQPMRYIAFVFMWNSWAGGHTQMHTRMGRNNFIIFVKFIISAFFVALSIPCAHLNLYWTFGFGFPTSSSSFRVFLVCRERSLTF